MSRKYEDKTAAQTEIMTENVGRALRSENYNKILMSITVVVSFISFYYVPIDSLAPSSSTTNHYYKKKMFQLHTIITKLKFNTNYVHYAR